jgi:hypothetical protein
MLSTVDQKSAADSNLPPTATKSDHNIVIILNNGFAERRDPMPELHYGQTVQYTTTEPGAKASMVFPELSPYLPDDQTGTEIPDSRIMNLVRPFQIGNDSFLGRCYLTLASGEKVTWDPANPEKGGGNHKVSKP